LSAKKPEKPDEIKETNLKKVEDVNSKKRSRGASKEPESSKDPKKDPKKQKKEEPKKVESKKVEPKKVEPKKVDSKRKTNKTEPKKVESKKSDPKKSPAPPKNTSTSTDDANDIYDFVCQICEEPGHLICCDGKCKNSFHLLCLKLKEIPDPFFCDNCKNGTQPCFVCHKADSKTIKCDDNFCSKYYHPGCLGYEAMLKFNCPLHKCEACKLEIKYEEATHCTRCATAYHDKCIPKNEVIEREQHRFTCLKHLPNEEKKS